MLLASLPVGLMKYDWLPKFLFFKSPDTLGFMEDQAAINKCSSSNDASEKTPESTVELNIKTLDSQTYTFQMNKNVRNLSSLYLMIMFASIRLHNF